MHDPTPPEGQAAGQISKTKAKLEERFAFFEKAILAEIGSHKTFEDLMGRSGSSPEAAASKREAPSPAAVSSVQPHVKPFAPEELSDLRENARDNETRVKTYEYTVDKLKEALNNRENELQKALEKTRDLEAQLGKAEEKASQGLLDIEVKRLKEKKEMLDQMEILKEELKRAKSNAPRAAAESSTASAQALSPEADAGLPEKVRVLEEKLKRSEEAAAAYLLDITAKSKQIKEQQDFLAQIRNRREQAKKAEDAPQEMKKLTSELDNALEQIAELRDELHWAGPSDTGSIK